MVPSAQVPLQSQILLFLLWKPEVWSSEKSFLSRTSAHFTDGGAGPRETCWARPSFPRECVDRHLYCPTRRNKGHT